MIIIETTEKNLKQGDIFSYCRQGILFNNLRVLIEIKNDTVLYYWERCDEDAKGATSFRPNSIVYVYSEDDTKK